MKTKKRGQVSIEAISLTAFLVLFLVLGMGFFMVQFSSAVNDKDNELLGQVSEIIVSELQMARSAEAGYEREFYIPYSLDLKDFIVSFPPAGIGGLSLSPAEGQVVMLRADGSILIRNILLGNDVSGALHNGENLILKSEDKILLIPKNMSEFIDARNSQNPGDITPGIAYTRIIKDDNHLSPLTVNSSVRCEVGIINADPNSNLRVKIRYYFEGSSSFQHTSSSIDLYPDPDSDLINGIHVSQPERIRDMYNDVKGYNISCIASLDSFPDQVQSKPLLIEDSIPYVQIVRTTPNFYGLDSPEGHYTWEVLAEVDYGDYDASDNRFNITFIAEGQNAGYLECTENCVRKDMTGSPYTITFKYSVPTEIGSCDEINRFGFKIRIENSVDPERTSTASKLVTLSCVY